MSVKVTNNTVRIVAGALAGARLGVAAGALLIETQMKQNSPVRTGNNRRSINTQIEDDGLKIRAQIGPNTDYAVYLEMGTRFMAAQPFIRPAYETIKGPAQAAIKAHIAAGIKGAA